MDKNDLQDDEISFTFTYTPAGELISVTDIGYANPELIVLQRNEQALE
jgi:hypothetical protein